MADEEFVDVKYSSGLSSRDSFVMEPAESSPIVNQTEDEKVATKEPAPDQEEITSEQPVSKKEEQVVEGDEQQQQQEGEGSWSTWGTAMFSAATSSVKALETGFAKVLDVIDDEGAQKPSKVTEDDKGGVKDDLRTLSSAVQKTSGKMLNSGMSMLTAFSKKTMEVLVAEEEDEPEEGIGSSLSSRLREAKADTLKHENEQKRQLSYWFNETGGNASFEAFRCFSQASLHSLKGKTEHGDEMVKESYEKIQEILSSASKQLINEWDSQDFSKQDLDLLDSKVFAQQIQEKLPHLSVSSDRLSQALEKARLDLLSEDMTLEVAYETSLKSLALFTAASIDFLHKNCQLMQANAMSRPVPQNLTDSKKRTECAEIVEIAAQYSTACLMVAARVRAVALAGKAAVIKKVEDGVQPDDDNSPELVASSLEMEATDCAAHTAKILAFLGPVLQHFMLVRMWGPDCHA